MSNLTYSGGEVFRWILQTTWQAAVLAGLILLAQRLLRKRLSPAWRYGLWLLLVGRLLMPMPPQSALSIFNLAGNMPSHFAAASPPALALPAGVNGSGEVFHPAVANLAEPVEAPGWKMDWFEISFCGWLAGVCFFGARLLWTNGRFRARIGGYQPVADGNVTRLFDECRGVFKITRPVRLIESDEVGSPAVYGFWRKCLLLPAGVVERFSTEELRCIFLHNWRTSSGGIRGSTGWCPGCRCCTGLIRCCGWRGRA